MVSTFVPSICYFSVHWAICWQTGSSGKRSYFLTFFPHKASQHLRISLSKSTQRVWVSSFLRKWQSTKASKQEHTTRNRRRRGRRQRGEKWVFIFTWREREKSTLLHCRQFYLIVDSPDDCNISSWSLMRMANGNSNSNSNSDSNSNSNSNSNRDEDEDGDGDADEDIFFLMSELHSPWKAIWCSLSNCSQCVLLCKQTRLARVTGKWSNFGRSKRMTRQTGRLVCHVCSSREWLDLTSCHPSMDSGLSRFPSFLPFYRINQQSTLERQILLLTAINLTTVNQSRLRQVNCCAFSTYPLSHSLSLSHTQILKYSHELFNSRILRL